MTDVAAGRIASRLEEAAQAIERSIARTRRPATSVTSDMSAQSRSAIEQEWLALKKDLSDLMTGTDLAASPEVLAVVERIRDTMSTVAESVNAAADLAHHKGRERAERINEYAHESPWQAAGLAAAVGFVLGVLLSRK